MSKNDSKKNFQPNFKTAKRPFYNLMMFPYPSAEGLHVGNMYAFTGSDIYGRFKKLQGYDLFEPIGLDGFGIHSENYAIQKNTHPAKMAEITKKNFYRQLEATGNAYAWDNTLETYDPEYYKWTQWIFIQMFKKGLAYRAKAPVNWCPSCKTVLADEQAETGVCERCKTKVVKKDLEQWFFRITDYADRLLADLADLDWSEKVKIAQKNWIGRSQGSLIRFALKQIITDKKADKNRYISSNQLKNPLRSASVEVFTTRPDTLFGATYLVLASEHPFIADRQSQIANWSEVETYIKKSKGKTEMERIEAGKEKTGIELKGIKAINPANNEEIPIYAADYVLTTYGTGAIMAVPAHDQRDFEFAQKYHLPIKMVICPNYPKPVCPVLEEAYTGEGHLVGSGKFDGMESEQAKEAISKFVGGKKTVQYKLRDWLISRQRYWGPPIPIIYCDRCKEKNKKTVLIVHGCGGRGSDNWYGWLANRLRDIGHDAYNPDMPQSGKPVLLKWLRELNKYKRKLNDKSIIIGHSLGAPAVLQFVANLNKKIDKLILVAPTSRSIDWKKYAKKHPDDPVKFQKNFNDIDIDFKRIHKNVNKIIYYYSDNDFYIPKEVVAYYKKMIKADFRLLKGRDHFNINHGNAYTFIELLEEIVQNDICPLGIIPVPEKDLPVKLPETENWRPKGTGQSPLANIPEFVNAKCPKCGGPAQRETDISDTFLDSAWYYLGFLAKTANSNFEIQNSKFGAIARRWLPVDMYIGGAEHSVLHLLYVRFLTYVFKEMGIIDFDSPFKKFRAHGLIIKDGAKMSKSRGNVVIPDQYIKSYGSDVLRMYLMFIGPFTEGGDFRDEGIVGIKRFLEKVRSAFIKLKTKNLKLKIATEGKKHLNITIKKVTEDIENLRFNTAISALMILLNDILKRSDNYSKSDYEKFLIILSPFAPHLSEDLWAKLGHKKSIFSDKWPEAKKVEKSVMLIPVMVNGRKRALLEVETAEKLSEKDMVKLALDEPNVKKWLIGKKIKRTVYVAGKIISIVV